MSQDFKLKFDRLKENNPARPGESDTTFPEEKDYAGYSHARTLCFLWPDSKRLFLNYAYLVSGEYFPGESVITLGFTSHTVSIKGNNLDQLYDQLMRQTMAQIVCADQRYMLLEEEISIVYEIVAEKIN